MSSETRTSMRTHTCGELGPKQVGKTIKLCGWVQFKRNHGGLIFIDLRDMHGITQTVFHPKKKKLFKQAEGLKKEYVVQVKGKVKKRPKKMENPKLETGKIEIDAEELEVINKSKPSPVPIEDRITTSEEVRLKHRYLDLRRPVMKRNFTIRHKAAKAARKYLNSIGFMEIETPLLVKSTPEGARDYIVPSRVHPGKFYALPQSPQLYKQILMVSGFDRYYQIARCLRDEDLRQDRQPEHTQIDFEMSFVDEKDIMEMTEKMLKFIFREVLGIELKEKFPVLSYDESMDKYGTDKPDLRFGLEISNVTQVVKNCKFSVFRDVIKDEGKVKVIFAEKDFSRKEIDGLTDFCLKNGAKGLSVAKIKDSKLEGGISKFFSKKEKKKILKETKIKNGYALFVADKEKIVNQVMGELRLELGRRLDLIDEDEFKFCWVNDYPLFSYNENEERWEPEHHMFTMPREEHIKLLDKNPGHVKGKLFDVILNGVEIGSGSIRISQPEIQEKVMKVIGMSKKEAHRRFGFLLRAYEYGGPVHGGMGLGFDRLVSLMCGFNDIRDVIAFPKNKSAQCPMDGTPSEVDNKQLSELSIKLDLPEKKDKPKR